MRLAQYISPVVLNNEAALSQAFATAEPFRHVVIDDFFDPAYAERLVAQFPPFERGNSLSEDGRPGSKSTYERIAELGDAYAELDTLVRARPWLDLIGRITRIDGLRHDPWYLGGGTHDNRHQGGLQAHVDFNFHPLQRWQRRLNLIVYLNRDWEPSWGGSLELYESPDAAPDQSIAPVFNRCVLFETHDHSWHGFSRIALPDAQRTQSRKSVALYFYTPVEAQQQVDAHSTVYVDRPLPDLKPGQTLSAGDIAELQCLIGDRDNRIAQQYREISKLMTLVRAHERGFGGAMLYAARRLQARLHRRGR